MNRQYRPTALLLTIFIAAATLLAQDEIPTRITNQNRTGDLPFSMSIGTDIEHVDVASGNLLIRVPIASVKGRGMDFNFFLRYDPHFLVTANRVDYLGTNYQIWNTEKRDNTGGVPFGGQWELGRATMTHGTSHLYCLWDNGNTTYRTSYIYHDEGGGKHPLAVQLSGGGSCAADNVTGPDLGGNGILGDLTFNVNADVYLADGTRALATRRDSNGNTQTADPGGVDTLGRTIVTQQNGTNQVFFKVYDANGVLQTYTINYSSHPLGTSFGVNGFWSTPIHEIVGGSTSLIDSIILPNGRSYQFQYESPNYAALTRIDLPTGGYITYTWATLSDAQRTYRYVASRTVNVGGQSSTWYFSRTGSDQNISVTVTDPLNNQSTYSVVDGAVTSARIYQGAVSGTPLRQYAMEYKADADPWQGSPIVGPDYEAQPVGTRLTRITTTLDDSSTSKKEFDYEEITYPWTTCYGSDDCTQPPTTDTYTTSRGNVVEIREFASAGDSQPVRRTTKSYLHNAVPAYAGYNIVNKIIAETILDGSSNQKAQTQFEYDTTALTSTGVTIGHDASYSAIFTYRGNVSKVKRWRNTDSAYVTTTYSYDDLGNIISIADPRQHSTSWSYDDHWSGTSCLPASNTKAFPTQRTDAASLLVKFTYYPCTGAVQARQDQNDINNGNRAGTTFSYDLLGRLTQKALPDGGQTSNSYNDVPPVTVTATSKITSSLNMTTMALRDGLGRVVQTQLTSDPEGTVYTDTTYDVLGRKATESNPYRSTSEPTYGITSYQYDALGRITKLIPTDGTSTANNVVTTYSGLTTTVIDQAGKQRRSYTDSLGRLVRVDEPWASGAGTPGSGSVSVSGTEQSAQIQTQPGAAGSGNVTISGSEQSKQVLTHSATPGTGWASISGTLRTHRVCDDYCHVDPDQGYVQATINGVQATYYYGDGDTAATVAAGLASAITYVYTSLSGSTINLTSKTSGSNTNYSLSVYSTSTVMTGTSFPISSGGSFTGGTDATYTTVYDSGSVSVTVNGFTKSASYGSGSSSSGIASSLATAFNGDGGSPVTASASSNVVTLTSKLTGASTNYSLSTARTYDMGNFTGPSFTAASGSALTGGQNAIYTTVYDAGTVSVAVGGFTGVASYGQSPGNSTSILVASALASSFNTNPTSPVTAVASSSTVTLTSKLTGAVTNYAVTSTSSTSQGTYFNTPSFTATSTALTGGADPDLFSNPYTTIYAYDVLNNLLRVDQKGSALGDSTQWRTRTFTYNSLSQLLCSANPEAGADPSYPCPAVDNGSHVQGTVRYTYDDNGNLQTRQDARNIITTFNQYDSLNRVTGKSYSNGDPAVSYSYDSNANCTSPNTNGIWRRSSMSDASGNAAWCFDPMGRSTSEQRTIGGITKTTRYSYNLDGSLAALTYPSNRAVTYTVSGAGRTLSAVDTVNNINYATNATYSPWGALTGLKNGVANGFNGIVTTNTFNKRLQPILLSATVPGSQAVLSLNYDFQLYTTDNGNVYGITNNLDGVRPNRPNGSAVYTYDSLNRLTSAYTLSTDCTVLPSGLTKNWGQNFSIDAWGNLGNIDVQRCSTPILNAGVDSHNRLVGNNYAYDAAGNMTNDGAHSYTFDAENRVAKLDSDVDPRYIYDGDGKRVKKATGTLYWTGLGADPLDESDLTGNINEEYVFFNARRIARLDLPSGTLHYYFADYLGSASVITSSTGSIEQEADYYPYGGERSITSGPSPYKFTGKERDSESGLDNFAARYFASSIGRFMTPDTEQDNPSPIPYADWRDPQTLNLYSYVRNNTPNRIDPDGHKLVCQNSTTTDQDGTIHVNVACHEESDDPPIPQQLSLIDLIRAFFYTDDPEAKTAIGTAAIRDIMTGRVSAGTLNDLIPSTLTNSNTPPPPTIPLKALKILDAIDLSNSAGPNIQGGKTFQNREGKLPPTDQNGNAIVYKEWDVTPRQAGGGRGTERMVTGSDGSAYYTSDHYRTFQKVR